MLVTPSPIRIFAALAAGLSCLALAACAGKANVADPPVAPAAANWRQVATEEDRVRLRGWRQAWTDALAKVHAGVDGARVPATEALFDPDRAQAGALPPPGRYTCRVYKLGANGAAMRDVTAYPAAECQVALQDGATSFYKVAGVQRPVGLLYTETPERAIFLGTMVFGDESRPLAYGLDTQRDLAGYIERIGPARWRLVLPYPHFESLLDVIELTPAPDRR